MNGKKISITRGIQKSKRRELNRLERANTRFAPTMTIETVPVPALLSYHNGGAE